VRGLHWEAVFVDNPERCSFKFPLVCVNSNKDGLRESRVSNTYPGKRNEHSHREIKG